MNLEPLIKWGKKSLAILQQPDFLPADVPFEAFIQKFSWLWQYQNSMERWQEMLEIIGTTETFVRTQGIYQDCHLDLESGFKTQTHFSNTKTMTTELVNFLSHESEKANPQERLVGSSEVLESILGKQKRLEQDQVKSGLTGFVLALAALVSKTTTDVVQAALETVSTRQVLVWCREMIGQSVQSKRKGAFSIDANLE